MYSFSHLSLDHPARYRICVRGPYEPRWLDLLSGVWVITDRATRPPMTTLVGSVADQAALLGVLEQLYAQGLPLVLVECVSDHGLAKGESASSDPQSA
ncbi:MAG: hypothetical protein KIT87_19970 [Anaerolineae bacterium]|nr:hypothetical protein [Anaerolineae bacterium]